MRLIFQDWVMDVVPEAGAIDSLRWRGHSILRPTVSRKGIAPLDRAAFVMAPYCGRIANGQFASAGEDRQLALNFAPEPHAIHGTAWTGHWEVAAQTNESVLLRYDDSGEDWPWPFRIEQSLQLGPDGLSVSFELTNLSDTAMPSGFGWHPYFPKGSAQIMAPVTAIWPVGFDQIPQSAQSLSSECDLRGWRAVAELDLDNPFDGEPSSISLRWPDRRLGVTMKASDVLSRLVIYTPRTEDFFCVEPSTHIPNAINAPDPVSQGLVFLEPGASHSALIALSAEEL